MNMKTICLLAILNFTLSISFAQQWNTSGNHISNSNSGNVGIGTSTPNAKLEVVGPATGTGAAIRASGGGDVLMNSGGTIFFDGNYSYATGNYIRPLAANTQAFFTSGTERLKITPDGKIGIGNANPTYRLDVSAPANTWKARFQGPDGYIAIGPANADWAHIYTDRSNFVFNAGVYSIGNFSSYSTADLTLQTHGTTRLTIQNTTGNVGIGTTSPNKKLTVNGTIYGKEVEIDLNVPGPDYVFEKDYKLPSLEEIKSYIDEHKHLPEVPSAKEMEANGINVGEMNMILLKKVEELTLYMIEANKEITRLNQKVAELSIDNKK